MTRQEMIDEAVRMAIRADAANLGKSYEHLIAELRLSPPNSSSSNLSDWREAIEPYYNIVICRQFNG